MNTAQKRYSALNIMSSWRGMLSYPTGTIDDTARAAVALLYSGLSYDGVAPTADVHEAGFVSNLGRLMGRR